ncbi:unnamed protein product [Symbiodinium sp. CCMP2592]|nr:unnamed protein product [Symbiodinium sp. CCMP2592]
MGRAMATIMLLLLVPASGLRNMEGGSHVVEQHEGIGQVAEHLDHANEGSSVVKHCQGDYDAPEWEKTGCKTDRDCMHCGRGWECYHRSEHIMAEEKDRPMFKAAYCTKIF